MKKKVIIFDDDEDILAICTFVLEEDGWEVFSFPDCEEIDERVKAIRPQVILMDNWISPDGGIAATQQLKNDHHLKDIPVVYFSANSDIETLAKLAGAEACLSKPFDLETLSNIVHSVTTAK